MTGPKVGGMEVRLNTLLVWFSPASLCLTSELTTNSHDSPSLSIGMCVREPSSRLCGLESPAV